MGFKSRLLLIFLSIAGVFAAPQPKTDPERPYEFKITVPSRRKLSEAAGNYSKITPTSPPKLILSLGTPAQGAPLVIDTTSGDTWVVDINAADQTHRGPWEFNATISHSLKNLNVPYTNDAVDFSGLKATVSGQVAEDIARKYDQDFSFRFALIEHVVGDYEAYVPDEFSTGSIGFGFQSTGILDRFLEKLFLTVPAAKRQLTSAMFECMLDDNRDSIIGALSMGSIDTRFCNTSTTVSTPLADAAHWGFDVTGYKFQSNTSSTRQQAVLDTRQLLTGVPAALYDYIYTAVNATKDFRYVWPIVDCNQDFPILYVNTTGDTFPITPELYIFKDFAALHEKCHLMLYPLSGGGFKPVWSFGYIWMYEKCITFDYGNRKLQFTDYNANVCDYNSN